MAAAAPTGPVAAAAAVVVKPEPGAWGETGVAAPGPAVAAAAAAGGDVDWEDVQVGAGGGAAAGGGGVTWEDVGPPAVKSEGGLAAAVKLGGCGLGACGARVGCCGGRGQMELRCGCGLGAVQSWGWGGVVPRSEGTCCPSFTAWAGRPSGRRARAPMCCRPCSSCPCATSVGLAVLWQPRSTDIACRTAVTSLMLWPGPDLITLVVLLRSAPRTLSSPHFAAQCPRTACLAMPKPRTPIPAPRHTLSSFSAPHPCLLPHHPAP